MPRVVSCTSILIEGDPSQGDTDGGQVGFLSNYEKLPLAQIPAVLADLWASFATSQHISW